MIRKLAVGKQVALLPPLNIAILALPDPETLLDHSRTALTMHMLGVIGLSMYLLLVG